MDHGSFSDFSSVLYIVVFYDFEIFIAKYCINLWFGY